MDQDKDNDKENQNQVITYQHSFHWKRISSSSRSFHILQATMNQSSRIFNDNAGKQCTAMVVAAIVFSLIQAPLAWSVMNMDMVLLQGNVFYTQCIQHLQNENNLSQSGFLLVKNLLRERTLFNRNVTLNFSNDPPIFGNVIKEEGTFPNLKRGLRILFHSHRAGILINNEYSFGVFHDSGHYYLYDSHSIGPNGSVEPNGKATLFHFDSFDDFYLRCLANLRGQQNSGYTLDPLDCYVRPLPMPNFPQERTITSASRRTLQHMGTLPFTENQQHHGQETKQARYKNLENLKQIPNHNYSSQNESDENRNKRLQQFRDSQKKKLKTESEEERNLRLKRLIDNQKKKLQTESEEERNLRLKRLRDNQKKKLQTESEEERNLRLQRLQDNRRKRILNESLDERNLRLQRLQDNQRKRIVNESLDERNLRLQRLQDNQRKRILNESLDERNLRCKRLKEIRERDNSQKHSTDITSKHNDTIAQFKTDISKLANVICNVCKKKCYPTQTRHLPLKTIKDAASDLLPLALITKEKLVLCTRCFNHLSEKKNLRIPSKAYWNNLDPGEIPDVISSLSPVERRLISRIILFLKIVKLSGRFGQFGFKGQTILFAQDVFEVKEQLPRSADDAGMIAIVECLEDINVMRQFQVDKFKIDQALDWLIKNNPLYKDVQKVTETFEWDVNLMARVQDKCNTFNENQNVREIGWSHQNDQNNFFFILRAHWHQEDSMFANPGRQSTAMALSAIVTAEITPPDQWTRSTIDQVLIRGDNLYEDLVKSSKDNVPDTGFHLLQNFQGFRNDFNFHGTTVRLDFEDEAAIFGLVEAYKNLSAQTLSTGLMALFQNNKYGILTSNSFSTAIMHFAGFYYMYDPRPRGLKGGTAKSSNGAACLFKFMDFQEFYRVLKRNLELKKNTEYTLHYVNVTISSHISNSNGAPLDSSQDCNLRNNAETQHDIDHIRDTPQNLENATNQNFEHQTAPIHQTCMMIPIDRNQPREDSVLNLGEVQGDFGPIPLYKLKRKTENNIVNEAHELKAEELAWFYLFPYGKNGLKEDREIRITPLDYYQFRIMGDDSRFQINDYLFYALSMMEYYKAKENIGACGKKIRSHGQLVEDVHLYIKNLRGYSSYWQSALNELLATVKFLGPPSFFLTFSCNDLNWEDMIMALLDADNRPHENPKDLSIEERQKLVEQYPVVVSRHFMLRVNALLKALKTDDFLLGGKLVDFWFRIEFQVRGSPHLHMLTWQENLPDFSTDAGIALLDSIITCEIPEDEEMKELVLKSQVHRHTHSCYKKTEYCRFGFPRKPNAKTKIIDSTSNEFLTNNGRVCILKRKEGEEDVNNYHPTLLKIWGGNMDIQPCGSSEGVAFYVAKYVSKEEPAGLDQGLKQAINQIKQGNDEWSKKMFRICMTLLNHRQISACECAFRLCHLKLRDSSRKTIFLNSRKPEQRYRVLNFRNTDTASTFCANIFDRYEKRPLVHANYDFENMSLLEFAMLFEPYYFKKPHDPEDEDEGDKDVDEEVQKKTKAPLIELTDSSKMRVRTKSAVPRLPYLPINKNRDDYFYSLLVQNVPFRKEADLLAGYENAEAAFAANENLLRNKGFFHAYHQREKELENALNLLHAFNELEDYEAPQNDLEQDSSENNAPVLVAQFNAEKKLMNVGQRELFNFITAHIKEEILGKPTQPLRIFITGGAGTGKTFSLKLIVQQIKLLYASVNPVNQAVRITAYTGVAAKLVNGQTLHKALKLPVQRNGQITKVPLLTGEILKGMRQLWAHTRWLIVDEISMVPYQLLCVIDGRLRQLKDCDELFGGINVLLFGDLMQLNPVSGNPVFQQPEYMEPATHLWRLFSFCELTENMRQRGDSSFQDMLNNLRFGNLTKEQLNVLLNISEKSTFQGDFAIDKALRIRPTKKLVADHNELVLKKFADSGIKINVITAQDKLLESKKNSEVVDFDKIIPNDADKTGGLVKTLSIFIGAKVMLRTNIDISKGLVNGAIGFITSIKWPLFRRQQIYDQDIPKVEVDFGDVGTHTIEPVTIQFQTNYKFGMAERRMLPLILCYSCTVHKLQGTTVNQAVVYLGKEIFAPAMAYVALSRVKSLDGLEIDDIDPTKLFGSNVCNQKALAEMNRLRSLPKYTGT